MGNVGRGKGRGRGNKHGNMFTYDQLPITYYHSSRGFSLIEMSLALVIMSIILAASFKLINAYTMQTNVNQQVYNISSLANAIKENAKLIMDASMTVCTNITAAYSNDGWGWRHTNCLNTSPLPIYNITTNLLTYSIDTANFSNQVNSIITNISPYCPFSSQTATTVSFSCSGLVITGLQYQTLTSGPGNTATPANNTAANTVNIFPTPHTNATSEDFLNFLDFPSALYIQYTETLSNSGQTISHYDMINAQSNVPNFAYRLDMTDLYLDRVKKTRDNLITLDAALRGYAIGAMTSEFENVPPNGLSSKDTFFVPWIWQALADTQNGTLTLCNNSTTCSSIVSGTEWATGVQAATYADVWMLITTNLLSANLTYVGDAFGNPLRIVPVANGCTGDVSGCVPSTNTPPVPQGSYLTAMTTAGYEPRPPYTGLIVSPLCTGGATTYPDFCRWIVVYPN
jgi:prepilin-type N-terminal cleavage/methylation domain-containing protein